MKLRNVFDHWPACHKWTDDYLQQSLGDTTLSVAVTPNGMYFMCKLKMIMHETIYIPPLIGSRDLFVIQLLSFSNFIQSANCRDVKIDSDSESIPIRFSLFCEF